MPTLLVFGASGAIGRFALPLLTRDYRILPVSRAAHAGWIVADLNDTATSWPDAEIALSLGPLDAFAGWLERLPAGALRRVVAISSMSAQTKQDSPDPAERALALRLRDAEARVRDAAGARGIDGTMFRPTLIYGAGIDRTLAPLAHFARHWHVLPVPFGASGLRQPVHAADLAAACAAVIANPTTFGKTYELGGGERLRFDAMIRRLRHCAPGFALPVPIPILTLHLLARPARIAPGTLSRLRVDLIADNAEAIRDFDYSARSFRSNDVLPSQGLV